MIDHKLEAQQISAFKFGVGVYLYFGKAEDGGPVAIVRF